MDNLMAEKINKNNKDIQNGTSHTKKKFKKEYSFRAKQWSS